MRQLIKQLERLLDWGDRRLRLLGSKDLETSLPATLAWDEDRYRGLLNLLGGWGGGLVTLVIGAIMATRAFEGGSTFNLPSVLSDLGFVAIACFLGAMIGRFTYQALPLCLLAGIVGFLLGVAINLGGVTSILFLDLIEFWTVLGLLSMVIYGMRIVRLAEQKGEQDEAA